MVGGGWGPVVTTTLVSSGNDPRTTGQLREVLPGKRRGFCIADGNRPIIAGLVFGGLFAAPFAALLCRKLHAKTLLILVGTLISALSLYNLYQALAA